MYYLSSEMLTFINIQGKKNDRKLSSLLRMEKVVYCTQSDLVAGA